MRIKHFIILAFLLVSVCPLAYASEWDSYILTCNDYEYYTTGAYGSVNIVATNGTTVLTLGGGGSYCQPVMTGLCYGIKVINSGAVSVWDGSAWRSVGTLPYCTTDYNGCQYTVQFGYGLWNSSLMNFPIYQSCTAPSLTIETSRPSAIMSDRYRFNFTIANTVGYGGITCSLHLNGSASQDYNTFTTSSVIDVMYTEYPKQFTIANVLCTYNISTSVYVFANQNWLVDNVKTYSIYDVHQQVGKVTTYPEYPSINSNVTGMRFAVLSDPNRAPYSADLIGSLVVNVDPATLNCTGVTNITYYYMYRTLTYGLAPYSMPLSWICGSPSTIPVTLTTKDISSGATVATATFNIEWFTGNLIIDNVNLIKNTNTSGLELWATVSNIFSREPIPASSNLTCNYSMTSQNATTFTGAMDVYNTTGGVGGVLLLQTDAFNNTVEPDTDFSYGDTFNIQINCSAENYTNTSIDTTRWVSAKRVRLFNCYASTGITDYVFDEHHIYFSQPYHTHAFKLYCTVWIEVSVNSTLDQTINNWLNSYNLLASPLNLILYTNYRSNDVMSACPEKLPLAVHTLYAPQPYGVRTDSAVQPLITSLYSQNDACYMTEISTGVIANNLIEFNIGTNTTTRYYYATTTAVMAFNLTELQGASISNPILAIQNTKTINTGIVEIGDVLSCVNTVTDPSGDIDTIKYTIGTTTGDLCGSGLASSPIKSYSGNQTTYTYTLQITPDTCSFFNIPSSEGAIKCTAHVYYSGQSATQDVQLTSNILPYITSASTPPISKGNKTCTNDWRDYFNPNCVGKTNSTGGGFTGLLFSDTKDFIVKVGLFIICVPLFIIIVRHTWSGNKQGGA